MISANNVTYRVGKKALFEDVNIKFTEGNCYGLIGANGAGKSTFLKILSGQLDTTKGDIVITPGQRLSVLEQDHFKYDDNVVMDTVIRKRMPSMPRKISVTRMVSVPANWKRNSPRWTVGKQSPMPPCC